MNRTVLSILSACLLFASAGAAQSIDGKWSFETKTKNKKRGEVTATTLLDLKSSGGAVTGTVSNAAKRRAGGMQIKDGKIEGNKFSFTTVQSNKKGETKTLWSGTVEGSELRGTLRPEKARKSRDFVAKRQ